MTDRHEADDTALPTNMVETGWHSWEMYNKETGQWAGDLQCSTESS